MSNKWNGRGRARLSVAALLMAAALLLGACAGTAGESTGVTSSASPAVSPGLPAPAGDSKTGVEGYSAQGAPTDGTASRGSAGTASSVGTPAKLVVVNKTMRIETAKVDEAIAKIRELVKRDGADISSMQVATAVDEPVYRDPAPLADGSMSQSSAAPLRAYVTVRVPSARYSAFIADAAKLGRVLTESETSDDVTQQHVDMQARLDNLKAEQVRLRQLFARATTVKDMLAVEQELTRVQGEIESLKAQLDYLERQAARATVTLELTEPKAIVRPAGTDWGVGTAVTDSIRAFVSTLNGLIVLLGPALALLAFVGLPITLIVWLVLRRSRLRAARVAERSADADHSDDTTGSGDLDS